MQKAYLEEFKGVKIKNRKKDLEIRQKLLKDSEGERKELDKLELEKERKDLRIESEDLKKIVEKVGFNPNENEKG